ncbi:hypothetical protein AN641_01210 [Candidatus Epulonipiscioides gigas]|nr:hypothetical protein AN641_01210 [Epulopiscium sp. SCG-C07WGA-EpuloA2]
MKKPNVVWILTDDQGMGDLGCTGNDMVKTPHIDEFYNRCVRMSNYHVGPTCAPTRSTLVTGHFANSTGVWHTIGGRSLLRKDEWTIATAFDEGGYETGIFGKWHLGDIYPYRACDRGFKKSITLGGGGISQIPDFWGNDYFDDTYWVDGVPQKFKGYCTDVFFEEGIKFIDQNKDKPFFCMITPNAPHGPLNVPRNYNDMYKDDTRVPAHRKRFYGMITNIDDNFGKLINYLEENNLIENTIVIFMTDNGTAGGFNMDKQGNITSGYNAGLRGSKNSEYDGGHRVPFFFRYDALNLNNGIDENNITASVDLMPTLLDFCGVDKGNHTFHGISLKPLLCNGIVTDRAVVTDSQRVPHPIKWRKSAVMRDSWRLVNGTELYDIDADRAQRNDISAEHPEVVEKLRADYDKWWELVSPKFDEEIPISIGEHENYLTIHDVRNAEDKGTYQQAHVREGAIAEGYFEIQVEADGKYEFKLRRWAREVPHKIKEGIDPKHNDIEFAKDCIIESDHRYYLGGVAIDLTHAHISIQGHNETKEIGDDDEYVSFILDLKQGATYLETWFSNKDIEKMGTYFVEVSKI